VSERKQDTRGDFRRMAEERDQLRRENRRLANDLNARMDDLETRQEDVEGGSGGYEPMSLGELDALGCDPSNPILPLGVVNVGGELWRGPGDPSGISVAEWNSASAEERAGMIRRLRR
jgi:hypothetical protein